MDRQTKARFTDEQIIHRATDDCTAIYQEDRRCKSTAEISFATFYKYKSKFGGTETSDAEKLPAIENVAGNLNKMVMPVRKLQET